jgi:hypothetical protein
MAHAHDLVTSYGDSLIQFMKNLAFVLEKRSMIHETSARSNRFGAVCATPGAI